MYVTISEAARLASKSHVYIHRLVSSGKIAGRRSGSRWMVSYDSLVAYFGLSQVVTHESIENAIDRSFGVEIEFFNADHYELVDALAARGITCELEGYNHHTRSHWKIVSDASVSGYNGAELVSPVLHGSEGMAQLEKVCEALEEVGAKVNKSCGLHVHLGIGDLQLQAVKNLVVNYNSNRSLIDAFMAPSRRVNYYGSGGYRYCEIHSNGEIACVLRANDMYEMVEAQASRYRAVNLDAYTRHGTVEFRQHQGTIEFVKISNWIYLVMALVREAKVGTSVFESLQSFLNNLSINDAVRSFFMSRARAFDRMGA